MYTVVPNHIPAMHKVVLALLFMLRMWWYGTCASTVYEVVFVFPLMDDSVLVLDVGTRAFAVYEVVLVFLLWMWWYSYSCYR